MVLAVGDDVDFTTDPDKANGTWRKFTGICRQRARPATRIALADGIADAYAHLLTR